MRQKPNPNAVRSLEAVIQVQSECPSSQGGAGSWHFLPTPVNPMTSKGTLGLKDPSGSSIILLPGR